MHNYHTGAQNYLGANNQGALQFSNPSAAQMQKVAKYFSFNEVNFGFHVKEFPVKATFAFSSIFFIVCSIVVSERLDYIR